MSMLQSVGSVGEDSIDSTSAGIVSMEGGFDTRRLRGIKFEMD